jgi:hypothetical protein
MLILAASDNLHRRHLGQMVRLNTLYLPSSWIRWLPPLRGDPLPSLDRVPPTLIASELDVAPVTLVELVVHSCGGCGGWTT